MKRVIITWMLIVLSISFNEAQSIQEAVKAERQRQEQQQRTAEEQKQREDQKRKEAEKLKREAEKQRLVELELSYQNAITSAKNNFEQGQYAKAKQDYMTALALKPAEANTINPKIAEINEFLLEQERAERETRYNYQIASAQKNLGLRQFDRAEQDYKVALELKPENAGFILAKIAEIDSIRNAPAILYIYRLRNTSTIGGILGVVTRYDVLLENTVIGRTNSNWKTTVPVSTFGNQTLSAEIEGRKAELRIIIQPGSDYYIRCAISSKTIDTGRTRTTTDRNGKTTTTRVTEIQETPILQLMEKSLGESEFNAIKLKDGH